ncbi:MAG TPA: hypothetical protein VIY48_04740 [Candidatus Paceibacterota bacterium]
MKVLAYAFVGLSVLLYVGAAMADVDHKAPWIVGWLMSLMVSVTLYLLK